MPSDSRPRAVPSPEVRHLKPLDGVRGLAILMVLATHCFESNYNGNGPFVRLIGIVLDCGRFGVDLFFVLSGFLITGILIDTRHDPHFFRNFFGRRALRIMPLYYGVLGALLLLSIPFRWQWNGMAPLLLTYLQNLRPTAIDTLAVGPGIGLFHFWSLAIEEQFYLLWPPLVYLLRGRLRSVCLLAVAASLLVLALRIGLVLARVPYLWIHLSLPTRADALLLGGLLAVCYRDQAAWARVLCYSPAVCVLLGVGIVTPILFTGVAAGPPLWIMGLRYTALALCFAALIAWSLKPHGRVRHVFELPLLRTLGKYSYGLYVLHVIVTTFVRLPLRGKLMDLTGSRALAVFLPGLLSILLSFAAAYLSFNLYEKRFLKLKSRFAYTSVEPARIEPRKVLA